MAIEDPVDYYARRAAASNKALVNLMRNSPELGISQAVWDSALTAGQAFGERVAAERCICKGIKRVEVLGSGWCMCPGCIELVHHGEPDDPLPLCGVLVARDGPRVLDTGSVTCSYCLHKLVKENGE